MTNFDRSDPLQPAAVRGASLGPRAAIARLARLCLKELRETLRDRRTIATLLLMPLLVYPLLSLVLQRLLVGSLAAGQPLNFVIAVDDEQALPMVRAFLERGQELLGEQQSHDPPAAGEAASEVTAPSPAISWVTGSNLAESVEQAAVDVAILVRRAAPAEPGRAPAHLDCELLYRDTSPLSKSALDYIESSLGAINDHFLRLEIQRLGGVARALAESTSRSVGGAGPAASLTTLVPLILILMTITGAVYPAIDLTAGERERGTLEVLMAAPVPRLGLLAAKYVAVLTVALLTAGANLAAMSITLITSGLGEVVLGPGGLSPLVIGEVLALLVLFAAFFSALLLALTSFARSFKEAQAYLIPLMLLSLAPGMLSLMPGLELDGLLAVTPLVNIVLLARDVFEGVVAPGTATLAVFSTALYALAAITVAARVFGTDALLYGSEGGWSDLWARPREPRPAATLTAALFCLAALVPAAVLWSGFLRQQTQLSMQSKLLLNALATVVLFGAAPLAAALLQRVRLVSGFRLFPARPLGFVVALVLGLAVWPLAHEVFLLNRWLGLTSLGAEQVEMVSQMLEQWQELSPLLILGTLALAPAVCEELLFRGYLFHALARVVPAARAIWVSALLFGIFHVVAGSLAAPERFLPSLFLGLILGWVAWRSGSVWPGMLLHTCHNGLLLMVAYYRDELAAADWNVAEGTHLPATWLITSLLVTAAACGLLYRSGSQREAGPAPPPADDRHVSSGPEQ